jgi:hypothetical protein
MCEYGSTSRRLRPRPGPPKVRTNTLPCNYLLQDRILTFPTNTMLAKGSRPQDIYQDRMCRTRKFGDAQRDRKLTRDETNITLFDIPPCRLIFQSSARLHLTTQNVSGECVARETARHCDDGNCPGTPNDPENQHCKS